MARLLDGCSFILQIRQWYWTWKAFLSTKNYFYQHQNISIIVKEESETCPIFEIAIIILSLKFIGSFFLYLCIISILISSNAYTCARFNEHSVLLIVTCSNKGFDLIWFEAAAFPFNKLFFAPSRFSLLSSRWLPCMPSPICSKSFKKKTSSTKNYLRLERNTKHWVDWRLRS